MTSRADLTHCDASCRNQVLLQFKPPAKPRTDPHVACFGHFQEAKMLFTSIEKQQEEHFNGV